MSESGLEWESERCPKSAAFGDIYYDAENGLDESRYVFVGQNALPSRFQNLKDKEKIIVAELGFGTGLNFLATWEEWVKSKAHSRGCQLQFISIEKFPLSKSDLGRALQAWKKDLEVYTANFLSLIPEKFESSGLHRFIYSEVGIELELHIGDAVDGLKQYPAQVDAWYFDGFAPRKNPEMWSFDIFKEVSKHSKEGTTFATYTCAGHVRRSLRSLGFEVEKFEGFGRKREMLKGRFEKTTRFQRKNFLASQIQKKAVIIGGGIAGVSAAFEFSKMGIECLLVERGPELGFGASGNPFSVSLPIFTKEPMEISQFSTAAFKHLLSLLEEEDLEFSEDQPFQICGAFLPARNDKEKARFEHSLKHQGGLAEFISQNEAEARLGIPVRAEGLWVHQALWMKPLQILNALQRASEPHIQLRYQTKVLGWEKSNESSKKYKVFLQRENDREEVAADFLVLANSIEALAFPSLKNLPLRPVRGQSCLIEAKGKLSKLKAIYAGSVTVTPAIQGKHYLGSTYDRDRISLERNPAEDIELVSHLLSEIEDLKGDEIRVVQSRVGIRASIAGELPLIGKLEEPGIYASLGHASRGFIYGPWAAKILAEQISVEERREQL